VADSEIGVSLGFDFDFPDREVRNNTFYRNSFVNNSRYVIVGLTTKANFWNKGTEGNYWGDYKGTDNNQDGIGDTTYIIDDNNIDPYPLTKKVDVDTIPEFSSWLPLVFMLVSFVGVCGVYKRKLHTSIKEGLK
jgi:hypothetical protein